VVRVGETLGVVERGNEGGGGHGPDARDRAQALDALIVSGHVLDRLVGIRELTVEVTHHREERGDQGEQRAREGQGADPRGEGLGTAGGDAVPLLAEQRPDHGDVAGARPDEGVPDEQAPAHVALGIGEAMRPAVGAEQTGVGQGAGVPAIGLHFASARGVHRGEVRVGDDHLVPQRLETPGHPLTVGRGLDHNPRSRPIPEDRGEALGLGADPPLDQFAPIRTRAMSRESCWRSSLSPTESARSGRLRSSVPTTSRDSRTLRGHTPGRRSKSMCVPG
jgi:hypothetical protein